MGMVLELPGNYFYIINHIKQLTMKIDKITICLAICFLVHKVSAQENITIDLSKNANQVSTQNVSPNQILNISLINKIPQGEYEITVEKKYQLPETLPLKVDSLQIKSMGGGVQMCASFLEKIEKFLSTKTENEVPLEKEILVKELDILKTQLVEKDTTEEGCIYYHVMKAEQALAKTEEKLLPQKIDKGQSIEVTIKRKKDNDKYEIWKNIYATEKKGKWLTTYGFTYITNTFKKGEPFFSKQVDSVFNVTPLNKRSRLSFVPSIFFTWFPYKDIGKDVSHSLTGGLGYDLEAPTAFLGYSLLYNQNIGISIGLSAHQQDFLNGRYNSGDVLQENLSEDQLNEKLYVINPYISINFRFGSAPFKGVDNEDSNDDE